MTVKSPRPTFEKLAGQGDVLLGLLWKNLLIDPAITACLRQYPTVMPFYRAVAGQPSPVILEQATPFLWHWVSNLLGAGDAMTTDMVRTFLRHLIDSFHTVVPTPFALPLGADASAAQLTLPKSGLVITPGDGTQLCGEDGRLWLREEGRIYPIADRSAGMALPDSKGMVTAAPDLFGADIADKLDRTALSTVADQVAGALQRIERLDPDLARLIERVIRLYVPVKPVEIGQHHSFTTAAYPGVIFLSPSANPLLLTEAIVHEYAHTELDRITAFEAIYRKEDEDATYYSPWRNDARPLWGLFHAIYVFFRVYEFLQAIDAETLSGTEQTYLRHRRELVRWRLRIGIAQVPPQALNPICRSLLTAINESLEASMRQARFVDSPVYPTLMAHGQRWLLAHPDRSFNSIVFTD